MVTLGAVVRHLAATEKLKAALASDGQALAARVRDQIGIREASRRTGLSPTYLSRVANGKVAISPRAFITLGELL